MNAAARLVHHKVLSRQLVLAQAITFKQVLVMFLALMVLINMLGVIYISHTNRTLYAQYERTLAEQDLLKVAHSQLLLERSAWMMQSRTQEIAQEKLGMIMPDNRSTVSIRD